MSLLDGIQEAVLNKGGGELVHYLNNQTDNALFESLMELGVDSAVNSIPGIGSAIATYKNKKELKNLNKFTQELEAKIEKIQQMVENKDEKDKLIIDDILMKAIETAIKSDQEDKIKFIVRGFESIIENDEISYDVASLYFDTLERITLLDIAVLDYYSLQIKYINSNENRVNFILEKFNIDLEIFQASRTYLRTLGLVETKSDLKVTKDIENIYDVLENVINRLNTISESIKDSKKLREFRHKKINKMKKLESKDRYQVSKFGRNLSKYFISNHE